MSKVICITGATSGFGWETALLFAKHDWKVIATGRRRERLEELKSQAKSPKDMCILSFDVSDRAQVEDAFASLPASHRDVEVLVNNAGLALGLAGAQDCSLDDWDKMVQTNINGLLYCTRAILPMMCEQNSGYVINIGSVAGNWPYPGGNVYGGTKAFVKQFSANLRSDLVGKQIRVTNIEPGLAETEFSVVRFEGDVDKASQVYEGKQPLLPTDIAETIYWLVSRPAHMNVNSIEIMATCQAWGPFKIEPA